MGQRDQVVLVLATIVVLVGVLAVAVAAAQSPQDLQRQLDRLQAQFDDLVADTRSRERAEALQLQTLHARLAAVEREVELVHRVIWGLVSMLLGNFAVSVLTYQRLKRANRLS